jgi:hypothetical protein
MRTFDFYGSGRTIAATTAQTLTWTQSEIASAGVVAYHVELTGTNNDLGAITRIRVNMNGQPFVDITPAQLISYFNTFGRGVPLLALTDTRFTIPLNLLDAFGADEQDVCQFPVGAQVQLDLVTDASTSAGSAFVSWTETNVRAQVFPRLLASQMNIAASVALARFAFGDPGNVRGLYLPHAGLQRFRGLIGGRQVVNAPSLDYLGAATGDGLAEIARLWGAGQDPAVPFIPITVNEPAPITGSFVEIQTGSGWAGVANELVVYAIAQNSPEVVGA